MGIISHYIKCYAKNKYLAVINGVGNFKKNRSADEKNKWSEFQLEKQLK